ncbi:MAG: hypothetical protein HY231_17345 [Acidobacteria bacterium]|nr:hypothetical protein [Acidobacteriota bacterium]
MKITTLIMLLVWVGISKTTGSSIAHPLNLNRQAPQTVTLYPPVDKATGRDDETRSCFSFKHGRNGLPKSNDWDLAYGYARIGGEDWLRVGTSTSDRRSVMKELGDYDWADSFTVPALMPLPELQAGEQRHITVDTSGDTFKEWAETTPMFVKAKRGTMYLMRVKDAQTDFYVLFRVEDLQQAERCTISWKRIPAPKEESLSLRVAPPPDTKVAKLLTRRNVNGEDNYSYAAFSFEFGGNGPEAQKLCRNDWDLLFGNSSLPDAFDVSMITDDRSRIRDLGRFKWTDKFDIPKLSAYEEPEREASVKAVEGHLYLVHTRDSDSNLYALFRVEKLEPGTSVEISWKVIPPPLRP